MAHVQKHKNRGWVARYRTPDGGERSRSFARKVDATNFLNAMEVSKAQGAFVDPRVGRLTFKAWVEQWWPTVVDLRPSSRARDESYMRTHITPVFGQTPLNRIDNLAVRSWVADLVAAGKAPATVHKAHQVLAKAMRAAVDAGLIASSPCEHVGLPRIEREAVRFLTPAEVTRLAEVIDGRYRAFVLAGAYSGLRFGELAGLRRSRVDLFRGSVEVTEILVEVHGHHTWGPPKTRAGRRTVPLPPSVVAELERHLEGVEDDDALVFTAPEGGPLRASLFRRRFFDPAVARAGLGGLTPHGLRHTAVAFWIAAGASSTEVAARAGHRSVVTVLDRYGHLLPKAEDCVTAALEVMAQAGVEEGSRTAAVIAIGSGTGRMRDGNGTGHAVRRSLRDKTAGGR